MDYHYYLHLTGYIWMIFLAYWIWMARDTKPTLKRQNQGVRYIILAIMIVSVSLLYSKHLKWEGLKTQLLPHSDITGILGVLVAASGLACCIWARHTLGRNWSGRVTLKVDHELIKTGPYAIVRHPIYTGFFLMVLGPVIIVGQAVGLLSLALCLFAVWQKSNIEEQLMMETFPNDYAEYKRHTKRLIPFIW